MLKKQKIFKEQQTTIVSAIEFFLRSRGAKYTIGTVRFYHQNTKLFSRFAEQVGLRYMEEITSLVLDDYMNWVTATGHNPGGKFMAFRTLKTFVRWFISAYEPEEYKDPFRNYDPPNKPTLILDPVKPDVVEKMINACPAGKFVGDRDKAILMTLIDTGLRASELTAVNIGDVDLEGGKIDVLHGKGDKARVVFFGEKTRKALRRCLRWRENLDPKAALFAQTTGDRLTYWGLRDMIEDRAKQAGVERPSLHAFRRGFALYALQNGMDVYSLQHLMGHADLQVLRRYLKQSEKDLQKAHIRASPMDRLKEDR